MIADNSLLLELPLPFKSTADGYLVELQAFNGLKKWADNFDRITVCAPVVAQNSEQESSIVWVRLDELPITCNVSFQPFPIGYRITEYLKHRNFVKDKLSALIDHHQYLCFSNLGPIGSWGNIAVSEAIKKRRNYSLWFDWVIHEMAADHKSGFLRRLKSKFDQYYSKHTTLSAIKNCQLGLFHGKTVYDAYRPYCKNPQLVHDIHLSKADAISDYLLNEKLNSIRQRDNLRIGYLGRLHPMKGPEDWLEIVAKTIQGLGKEKVKATWLGDGPVLEALQEKIVALDLTEQVSLLGFENDRGKILSFLREIDVFLFCHKTPESPRCLIESLVSGTPIVGYTSAYASDLVSERGGGFFTEIGNTATLSDELCKLARDRNNLASFTTKAASNKHFYNDDEVFQHRSNLIKKYT